jgi:hypothetical protein
MTFARLLGVYLTAMAMLFEQPCQPVNWTPGLATLYHGPGEARNLTVKCNERYLQTWLIR